jgi:hypothetical protein
MLTKLHRLAKLSQATHAINGSVSWPDATSASTSFGIRRFAASTDKSDVEEAQAAPEEAVEAPNQNDQDQTGKTKEDLDMSIIDEFVEGKAPRPRRQDNRGRQGGQGYSDKSGSREMEEEQMALEGM